MAEEEKSLSFQQILDYCSAHEPARSECGWRAFLKRYKIFIYQSVSRSSLSWSCHRLKCQLSDAVNDIVSEVIWQLCKNEGKALRDFKAKDDEFKFLAWLAVICNRATNRYMKNYFTTILLEDQTGDMSEKIADLDFELRWELYESIISLLRQTGTHNRKFLERDIHIFQLYVWADFSSSMITSQPCFLNIGHRVVDNVVNRMRDYLLKSYRT